ncbi:MAG TPA: uroporphyrinogen decarboxylase family protein [Candidatus Methylomirabilis sp.]|nr:uroporphyrinogen decarboxylase family protein [Candidatus Methylomirabilis sp.]
MTSAEASKSQRVRLSLAGEVVDRTPVSFWVHNFARENTAEELAQETIEQYRRYDWDFIKVQSRASVFAEAWGSRYRHSRQRAVPPVLLDWPVHAAQDLAAIRPLDVRAGPLGEQIAALRMIRREVGPLVPVILTIFAPAMVLQFLAAESPDAMLGLVRNHPEETHAALAIIRDTLASYAQACLDDGADGIFLAVKAASAGQMTRQEYADFGLPYDRPILEAAGRGWLNMLHLCNARLYFDVAKDLPAPLLSWGLDPGNPSLSQGRDLTGRAVIGGVSAKPRIRSMTPEEVRAEVLRALDDTAGVRTMIGPGCSISPDTPEANLFAVRSAVEEWQSTSRDR